MTASAICVTPANSQDETSLLGNSSSCSFAASMQQQLLQHPWFRKLIDRDGLSSTDWEELQQQKSQLPGLWETAAAASDGRSSSSASLRLVQGQAMVQDMLESQYFCSPSLEYGMTEQTRLVLVPVPTTAAAATTTTTTGSMDTEEAIISEQHRDKRLKQQQTQKAVLGQLYYEQYQQQQQQQQQQECEMPIIQNKLCLNDLVEFVGVWQAATDHEEEESTPRSNASMDHDDDDDDDDVWMNHPNHYHPNNSNLSSMLDIPHRMMMYNHEEQETSTCSSPITHNQQLAARFHILWYRRLESLEQATNSFMSSSSSSSLLKQQEVLVAAVPNDTIVFHHHHDSIPSILARALHLDSSSTITAHAVWMTLLSMAERSSPPAASTTTTSSSSSSSSSSSRPITTPHDTTLGCASLHMALQDVTACRTMQLQLQHVLSQIVPFVQVMDLSSSSSSSSSSTGSFFSDTVASVMTPPHKQQGRLQPTPLQMPMGSTLILNIGDGSFLKQCASNGSTNNNNNNNSLLLYQALQELTLHHRMPYRFDGGMQLYFEADVRVIVLSTTTSSTTINSNDRTGFSLLPCTLQVACQFSPQDGSNSSNSNSGSHDEANVHENETILLQQVRHYLAKARCRKFQANNNIRLPQAVLEQAQKDFLERRQQQQQQPIGNKSDALVGEDDLHRWLTITRLQARSRQASEASLDDWQRAVELDDAIKESFRP